MEFNPPRAIVHNEGCDLHYWYQGTGPPHHLRARRQWPRPAVQQHDRRPIRQIHTCATFDRRQMPASQVRLSIPQQAQDIRAVITAVGGAFDKPRASFGARLLGYDDEDEGVPKTVPPEPENEFPALLGYVPNLWRLRRNGTSIGVSVRAVRSKAKILECPKLLVLGHHHGFGVEAKEFLTYLLYMLEILEDRRRGV
ncbi:uncharacterized protein B0T15DRAFT_570009 [Chaetomium strumarium]|uniref:Uncharacterized protein n=1 Tax=Chaetomium strumarium TaxID=1170767 RepID=A0AAJ0GKQ8_9PEZI|nr:hypothetical protein B0T15DRAFT_570009 [Chaetomium strumarium]